MTELPNQQKRSDLKVKINGLILVKQSKQEFQDLRVKYLNWKNRPIVLTVNCNCKENRITQSVKITQSEKSEKQMNKDSITCEMRTSDLPHVYNRTPRGRGGKSSGLLTESYNNYHALRL